MPLLWQVTTLAGTRGANRGEMMSFPIKKRRVLLALARVHGARYSDLLSADDIMSLADFAMSKAWRRFDPALGSCFVRYASKWVINEIRRAAKAEIHQRGLLRAVACQPAPQERASPERIWSALQLLEALTPLEAEVFWRVTLCERFSEVGRTMGYHRSWVLRIHRRARKQLASLRASACSCPDSPASHTSVSSPSRTLSTVLP